MKSLKKTTLLVLLDAFRWDYLSEENTPTLWSMAQNGLYVQQLKPSYGYCERSEIFTGTRPDKNGNFCAITRNANYVNTDKNWLLTMMSSVDNMLDGRGVRQCLRRYSKNSKNKFVTYQIPLDLIPYFSLTEDKCDHTKKNGFIVESLFDVMLYENKKFCYDSFTALGLNNGNDSSRQKNIIRQVESDYDLYLLYVGSTDTIIHHSGTKSIERYHICREVDTQIQELKHEFEKIYQTVEILIIGDHGMTDVLYQLDVWQFIMDIEQKYRLRNGRDYIMFLDSTMARFWFINHCSRKPIEDIFNESPFMNHGRIMTTEMGMEMHVPAPSSKYGELIWCANPGVIIFPDYFHRYKPVNAMHGYDPNHSDSKGMAIVSGLDKGSKYIQSADLIDICPTISDLLDIPHVNHSEGKSLL